MDDTLASVGNTYNGSIDPDDEFIGRWEDIDAYSMVRVWINTPASAILTIEYASSMVQLDVLPLVADQVIAEQIFACYPGNHSSIHNIKKAKYVRIRVKNTSNEAQAINIKTKYANKVPHPFLHYTNDNIDAHVSVSLDTINVDANAVNDKETSSITVYGLKEHQDTAPESAYRAITVDDTGRLNVNATGQVVVYAVDPSSTPTILKVDNDGRLMVSTDGGGGAVNGEVTVINFPLDGSGESLKVTGEVTTSEATSGVTVYGLNGNNPVALTMNDNGRLLVSTEGVNGNGEVTVTNFPLDGTGESLKVTVFGLNAGEAVGLSVTDDGTLNVTGDVTVTGQVTMDHLASSVSVYGQTIDNEATPFRMENGRLLVQTEGINGGGGEVIVTNTVRVGGSDDDGNLQAIKVDQQGRLVLSGDITLASSIAINGSTRDDLELDPVLVIDDDTYIIHVRYGKDAIIGNQLTIDHDVYTTASQLLAAVQKALNRSIPIINGIPMQWRAYLDSGRATIEFRTSYTMPPVQTFGGRYHPFLDGVSVIDIYLPLFTNSYGQNKFERTIAPGTDYALLCSEFPFTKGLGSIECKYDISGCYPCIGLTAFRYPINTPNTPDIMPHALWIEAKDQTVVIAEGDTIVIEKDEDNWTTIPVTAGTYGDKTVLADEIKKAIITHGLGISGGSARDIDVSIIDDQFRFRSTEYVNDLQEGVNYVIFPKADGVTFAGGDLFTVDGDERQITGPLLPNSAYNISWTASSNGDPALKKYAAGVMRTDVPGNQPWHGVVVNDEGNYEIFIGGTQQITELIPFEDDDTIDVRRTLTDNFGNDFSVQIIKTNTNHYFGVDLTREELIDPNINLDLLFDNKLATFVYLPDTTLAGVANGINFSVHLTNFRATTLAGTTLPNRLKFKPCEVFPKIGFSELDLTADVYVTTDDPAVLTGAMALSEYKARTVTANGDVWVETINAVPAPGDQLRIKVVPSQNRIDAPTHTVSFEIVAANGNFYMSMQNGVINLEEYTYYPLVGLTGEKGYTTEIRMSPDPFYFTDAQYQKQWHPTEETQLVVNLRTERLDPYLGITGISTGVTSNGIFRGEEVVDGAPISKSIATDLDGNIKTALVVSGQTVTADHRLPVNLTPLDSGIKIYGSSGDELNGHYVIDSTNNEITAIIILDKDVEAGIMPGTIEMGTYTSATELAYALEKGLNFSAITLPDIDLLHGSLTFLNQWKCDVVDNKMKIQFKIYNTNSESALIAINGELETIENDVYFSMEKVTEALFATAYSIFPVSKSTCSVLCQYLGEAMPIIGLATRPGADIEDLIYALQISRNGDGRLKYYAKYPRHPLSEIADLTPAEGDRLSIRQYGSHIYLLISSDTVNPIATIDAGLYSYETYYPVIHIYPDQIGTTDPDHENRQRIKNPRVISDPFLYGAYPAGLSYSAAIEFGSQALADLLGFDHQRITIVDSIIGTHPLVGTQVTNLLKVDTKGHISSNIVYQDKPLSLYNRLPVSIDGDITVTATPGAMVGTTTNNVETPVLVDDTGNLYTSIIYGGLPLAVDNRLPVTLDQELNGTTSLVINDQAVSAANRLPVTIDQSTSSVQIYGVHGETNVAVAIDETGNLNANMLIGGTLVSDVNPVPITGVCVDPSGLTTSLAVDNADLIILPPIKGRYSTTTITATGQNVVYTLGNTEYICPIVDGDYTIDTIATAIERAMNKGLSYVLDKGIQWRCTTSTSEPNDWSVQHSMNIEYIRRSGFPDNFDSHIGKFSGHTNSYTWDQESKTYTNTGTVGVDSIGLNVIITQGAGAISLIANTGNGYISLYFTVNGTQYVMRYVSNRYFIYYGVENLVNLIDAQENDIFGIKLENGHAVFFYIRNGETTDLSTPIDLNNDVNGVAIVFTKGFATFVECHLDPYYLNLSSVPEDSGDVTLNFSHPDMTSILTAVLDYGVVDRTAFNSNSASFSLNGIIDKSRILNLDNSGNVIIDHSTSSVLLYGLSPGDGGSYPLAISNDGTIGTVNYGTDGSGSIHPLVVDNSGNQMVKLLYGNETASSTNPIYVTFGDVTGMTVGGINNGTEPVPLNVDEFGSLNVNLNYDGAAASLNNPIRVSMNNAEEIVIKGMDDVTPHAINVDNIGRLNVNMFNSNGALSAVNPLTVAIQPYASVSLFGDDSGVPSAIKVDTAGNIQTAVYVGDTPVSLDDPMPVSITSNVIYGRDAGNIDTIVRVDSSGTLNTRLLLANNPISALNPLPSQLYGTDGTDVQPIKVSTDGYINSILSGTDPSGEIIPIKVNRRGTMLTVFEKETLGELYPIMQGGAYQGLTAFKYSSIDEVIFRPSVADGLVGPELPNSIQLEKTTSSEAFISSVSHLQYSTVGQRYVCRVNCNIVPGTTNSNTFVGFGHEEDGIYMGYRRVNAPAIPCIMHKRRGAQCVVAFRLNLSSGGFVNRDGTTIWANNLFTHGGSAPTNTFYLSVTINNITYIKSLSTTNPSVDFITQSLLDTGWTYLDGSPGSPHDDWYIETREGINSITIIFTAKKAENRGSLGQLANVSIKYHRNNASGLLFDNYDVYMLRGDSPTFNYILSSEWNVDKLDGSGPSSHIYDPDSPKNFQFIMGSQTITCQMLIGDEYATVHIIEDLGTPPFNNPLIAFHAFTNNDGIINVIDYACFAEGPPLPRPTSVVSHFGINNAGIDATSFRNIITVRNNYAIISRDYLTGRVNRSPIVINSVTGFSTHSPFIRIALIKNVEMNRTISGTILRDTYKSLEQGHDKEFLSSGTSKDYDNRYGETVASTLIYPSTFLLPDTIWSAVVPVNQAFEYKFNDNEIMLYPGEWISLVAIASGSGTPTIYGTINTSELA